MAATLVRSHRASRRRSRLTHVPKLSRRRNRPPKTRRHPRSVSRRWEKAYYAGLGR